MLTRRARAGLLPAVAAAVVNAVESGTGEGAGARAGAGARGRLVAWLQARALTWLSPVLRNGRVWPPSRRSAPALTGAFGSLLLLLWAFVRQRNHRRCQVVEERRRDYALSSLDNLIANEDIRLEAEAKKETKKRRKEAWQLAFPKVVEFYMRKGKLTIVEPNLVAHYAKSEEEKREEAEEKKKKEEEEAAEKEKRAAKQGAKSEPEPEPEDEEGGEKKRETKKEKREREQREREEAAGKPSNEKGGGGADPKIKPPADKLFELLFDEIEHAPITTIGVSKKDERFNRGMKLLRVRVKEEIEEAIENTRTARKYTAGVELDDAVNVPKNIGQWVDGTKMVKVAKFARDQVCKGMRGKHPEFDAEAVREIKKLVKQALLYSKEIGAEHRRAARQIWLLLKPWLGTYLAGVGILLITESSWGVWYAKIMALPNMALEAGVTMNRATKACVAFFVWFLFNWPADNLGDTLVDNTQAFFTLGLRDQVMRSILRQDREYFDFHQAGVLQERLNRDTGVLSNQLIQQPKNLLSALCRIAVRSGIMYVAEPRLFRVAMLVPIPFTVVLSWLGIKLVRKLNRKIHKVNDVAAAGSINVLKEMVTVRQFAMEQEEHERYAVTNLFRHTLHRKLDASRMFTWGLIGVGFWGTQILITYLGLGYIIDGTLTSGELVGVSLSIHEIIWTVRYLIDLVPQMMELIEPIEHVATTLDSLPRIEPHPDVASEKAPLKPDRFRGHLVFDKVKFTYPTEKQKPVLKGFSFEVKPGQKVACVGRAGCGKSTSVGLLQRLYEPDAGRILIDGKPIQDYDVHFLRRSIGIVAQDNVLFATSIKENIIYGMGQGHLPMPTDEEIWDVCEKANAREFIESFPNRLNTHVGERGVKLSGGQKQRIAIARAMIRKPKILLLDEATSALDPVNEKVVQRALDQLMDEHAGVAIVIAHRLTTIKNCDNIVMMEDGRKAEEGTHAELMAIQVKKDKSDKVLQGLYHNQWDTQMGVESFGSPEHMTKEQLAGRVEYLRQEKAKLDEERETRDKEDNELVKEEGDGKEKEDEKTDGKTADEEEATAKDGQRATIEVAG
jgi:ABC-type multidrug transport system fused ATPase/permease subunit